MAKQQKHVPSTYAEVLAYADRTQSGINSEKESVAGYLLRLAQSCTDPDHFQAGCEAAENERRSNLSKKAADSKLTKAARKELLRLPACWSQPKSMLIRGWTDLEMVPKDYQTYSAFSIAKREKTKEAKTARQASVGGGDNTSTVKADGAKDALKAMEGSVTAVLFVPILGRVARLDTKVQESIAFSLEQIVGRFEKLATESGEVETIDPEEVGQDALDELEAAQISGVESGETDGNMAQA